MPVMATWIIRSRTGTLRRRKKCYPCLQTQEGECRIRRRHQQPHARTTIRSCNGEASCMGRVFTTLQRLLDDCLHGLSSRSIHWTRPHISSLPLATLTDLGRSLARLVRTWNQAHLIVQPETLLRGPRELFRMYWKRRSKASSHRPKGASETIALIRQMATDNRL